MIISNTTPLINFAELGRVDLLEGLFGEIWIPPAVSAELSAKASLFPSAAVVPSLSWVRSLTPGDAMMVSTLRTRVHAGEAECITLAMENPGSLLILDDLEARTLTSSAGLPFVGTLGCLVEAKKRGLIVEVAPLLEELRTKARFWIADVLAKSILQMAGE